MSPHKSESCDHLERSQNWHCSKSCLDERGRTRLFESNINPRILYLVLVLIDSIDVEGNGVSFLGFCETKSLRIDADRLIDDALESKVVNEVVRVTFGIT